MKTQMSINPFVTDNILCALQEDLKWNVKRYFFQMLNCKIISYNLEVAKYWNLKCML